MKLEALRQKLATLLPQKSASALPNQLDVQHQGSDAHVQRQLGLFEISRFRALIIGRPNAGKTTILKCIAQSADGRVDPSSGRGIHDINKGIVFNTNRGFVFHDSRGIEAGTTNELDTIRTFISERAKATSLGKKLHAIWYCIPTDTARLVSAAELQFFDEINPDGVPVILIFTKFESQEAEAFRRLKKEYSVTEALERSSTEARHRFEQDHLTRFMNRAYPPKEVVYLKDMDKEHAQCSDIIKLTAKALTIDVLLQLFITVQQTNISFRIVTLLKSVKVKAAVNAHRMNKHQKSMLFS